MAEIAEAPLLRTDGDSAGRNKFWAIVLAGGEGIRLRPLIRRLFGEDRPKQYASLVGSRSLLRATLDRVALKVPLDKTVVVTSRWHAQYAAAEFTADPTPKLLIQPRDLGTAAGVLFPAYWVRHQDPEAVIAVFPSDHFMLDESAFMNHVEQMAVFAGRHPDRLLLAGARPTGPEAGFGWIEPADALGEAACGTIRGVRRFWEKPPRETARSCFEKGCLWSTFVMVGSVSAFAEAGRRFLPRLDEQLRRVVPFLDTEEERRMLNLVYASASKADFSQAILAARPPFLAVSQLPEVGWSDWGTPGRVLESLNRAGISPPWLQRHSIPALLASL